MIRPEGTPRSSASRLALSPRAAKLCERAEVARPAWIGSDRSLAGAEKSESAAMARLSRIPTGSSEASMPQAAQPKPADSERDNATDKARQT
jgi:hypothetical protein